MTPDLDIPACPMDGYRRDRTRISPTETALSCPFCHSIDPEEPK